MLGASSQMHSKLFLLLIVALLPGMTACEKKKEAPPAPPPPAVKVVTLQPSTVTLTTDLPGRTVAYRVADIRPQVGGLILKRLFTEGGDVEQNEQLYQIDPALYRATYESAKATAQSSRQQVDRYKPLAEVNAVSRQDFDNAVATAAQNKASESAAQINLVYTKLLSPISGRIGRSTVTEGALVTAGQATALATVQQIDPIYVDVTQPSAVLLRLKREMAAGQLHAAGDNQAEVRLTLEDGSEYPLPGTLQFSEVQVDASTGSVTLRALFPNPDKLLLPGMFVHQRIEEGQRSDALLVPQQAVTHDQKGDPLAMVVGAENKVEARHLKTDRTIGDQWLVTEGLKAGDKVIVEGLQFVKPGAVAAPEEFKPDAAEKKPAVPAQSAPAAAR